jgi:hypothetical protein
MDPMLLAALIGGGSNILGSLFNQPSTVGDPSDVTNLNAEQQAAFTEQLNNLFAQSSQQQQLLGDRASQGFQDLTSSGQNQAQTGQQALLAALGQGQIAGQNAQQAFAGFNNVNQQFQNQAAFDPNQANQLFQSNVSSFEDIARRAQTEALSNFENPAATQAALQADRNVSAVANQFAGLGGATSGAAAAAAAQGAQAPLAQLASDRANLANQAYLGTLSPLLQQGQQNAVNQSQFQYQSGTQNLLNQLASLQSQGQLALGQGGAANQAVSNASNIYGQGIGAQQIGAQGFQSQSALNAGLQSSALQGLSGVSQPEFYAPALQPGSNPINDIFTGALQGLTIMDLLNFGGDKSGTASLGGTTPISGGNNTINGQTPQLFTNNNLFG